MHLAHRADTHRHWQVTCMLHSFELEILKHASLDLPCVHQVMPPAIAPPTIRLHKASVLAQAVELLRVHVGHALLHEHSMPIRIVGIYGRCWPFWCENYSMLE